MTDNRDNLKGKEIPIVWITPFYEDCIYCGESAGTRDHVIPVSYGPAIQWLVPACKECNLILGSNAFFTVWERREFVHSALIRKYKKLLSRRMWSKLEIEEVGISLQKSIVAKNYHQRVAQRRVEFSSVFYGGSEPGSIREYKSQVLREKVCLDCGLGIWSCSC